VVRRDGLAQFQRDARHHSNFRVRGHHWRHCAVAAAGSLRCDGARASQLRLSANDKPRPQVGGQHRQVDQVDKERADDRHDDKACGGGPWRRVNACMLATTVAVAPIAKPQKAPEMIAL
jgi:hypothetical protein